MAAHRSAAHVLAAGGLATLAAVDLLAQGKADSSYDAIWLSSNDYLHLRPEVAKKVVSGTPVFPILFGDSDRGELQHIADLTGGRLFDARKGSLDGAFEEIRGYQ
ncbi:hypothetical protein [Streptomyces sp. NPDC050564]|uniref:hypothetical protein n=1 Tax=Streptomyces sp. NPDC050564 TaxID=3365631 RepID=UPI00379B8095